MIAESPEISIVVPAFNQAEKLRRLLESLRTQEDPPPFEIVVVDDCSPDHTASVLEDWARDNPAIPARCLRLTQNGGPGRARNAGLRESRGRVVAFTDTDCVADPHWLAALPRKLDAAARIVGTGGRVKALFEDSLGARYNIVNRSLEPQETLSYLVTCNCCYLREPLLEAGGFMEDIRSPGGEDIAASIALWKRGWRFVYEPDALVYHEFRNSLRNFVRTWINYGYGCALVAHRLLTREELWPELGRHDAQNYWCVLPIRPDVTGVRSFLRDQYHFFFTCGKRGVPVPARMGNMFLRAVDRVSYYHGWRKGLARFRKEGGTVHMLS